MRTVHFALLIQDAVKDGCGLMYRGERKACCARTQLRGSIWNLWGGGCVSLSVRQREVCSFNAKHGDGCLALARPDSDVVVLLIFVIARASVEVGFVGQVRFGYMSVPLRKTVVIS